MGDADDQARLFPRLLPALVLLAVTLGLGGGAYYRALKHELRELKFGELSAVVELKAREIAVWRAERAADLRAAAASPFAAEALEGWLARRDPARGALLASWLESLRAQHGYRSVVLFDPQGGVLLSAPQGTEATSSARGYAAQAARAARSVFSTFEPAGPNGAVGLSFFAPVRVVPGGPAAAVIGIVVDPYQFLYPFIHEWPTRSSTAETLLVERRGPRVVFLSRLRHRPDAAVTFSLPLASATLPAAQAVQRQTGTVEGLDYRGQPVLAAYRSIPETGWSLVAKVDEVEAYAPLKRTAVLLFLLGGLLVLAAAAAAALFWARQGARLQRARRERLEEEKVLAERASEAKGQFLAQMSHEIRTPMNGVLGVADLLLETELVPDQRECVAVIRNAAESLLLLIDELLDYAKIEAGRVELESVAFELREVVEGAAAALAVGAHRKGLELIASVSPALASTRRGDPVRLRQILLNLMGNAIKFTQTGEVVARVEPGQSPGQLVFSVRDTGVGTPEEQRQKLLETFAQLEAGSREPTGTGLGLAIAKTLVERMGGRIWLEAEPGAGCTFRFEVELPLAPGAPDAPRLRSPLLEGRRALVADRCASAREFLREELEALGVTVETAAGGREALEVLSRAARSGQLPDVALLDLQLGDLDAFSLVEALSPECRVRDVAVVLIASVDTAARVRRAQELGLAGHLMKPIRRGALRERVEQVCAGAGGPARARLPAAGSSARPTGGPRVLLVEDNRVNRAYAERVLRGRGVEVLSAGSGAEALEVAAERYDLVLMDVQMPELDGLETTRILRKRGVAVPIVGLSAHATAEYREPCLAAGMDDYLVKPIAPKALYESVERWASGRRARRGDAGGDAPPAEGRAVEDFFGQLRSQAPEEAQRMLEAAARGDATAVERAAHGLRGALGLFGAASSARLAREIEESARKGDLAAAAALAGRLAAELPAELAKLDGDGMKGMARAWTEAQRQRPPLSG